jgi:two-component system, response regulator PdtaR
MADDQQLRVLLVEDQVMVRMSVSAHLRQCGYSVIETSTADEACQVLVAGVTADVLFTDICLPGSMDGIALARYTHFMLPQAKIVLGTAFDSLALGAADLCHHDALLTKPYAYDRIASTIARLLVAHRAPRSELRGATALQR